MILPESLFLKAVKARKNAYAPYSKFKVGAAILSAKGNVYVGANVENVSYPCGICAETAAIAAMVAGGENLIQEIVIVADSKEIISPCGACLQRISEFSNQKTTIHLADLSGIKKSYTLGQMLPFNFDEESLRQ